MTNYLATKAKEKVESLKGLIALEEYRVALIESKFSILQDEAVLDCFKKLGVEQRQNPTLSFVEVTSFDGKVRTAEELEKAKLTISYRVEGVTLKPILFDGYTKNGAGKNSERLYNKAKKLEEKIFKLTGYVCSINHYSLEVKDGANPFYFTIDFKF